MTQNGAILTQFSIRRVFAVHSTFHSCTVNIFMLNGLQHKAAESLCPNCPNIFLPCLRHLQISSEKKSSSHSLPQREDEKNESTRPRTQSIGPVLLLLLLLHKSQVLLHKKTGGDKDRGHVEKGAIPLICVLGAFQGKAAGPACFIANASVTSKDP